MNDHQKPRPEGLSILESSSLVKAVCAMVLALLLGGCASVVSRSLPYDAWSLNFFNPDYMEVWIETASVVDINERVFLRAGSGIPSTGYPRGLSKGIPAVFKGDAKGWFENPAGKGRNVTGAVGRCLTIEIVGTPTNCHRECRICRRRLWTLLKAGDAFRWTCPRKDLLDGSCLGLW